MQPDRPGQNEARIPIHGDPDIVRARQAARELASRVGFSPTDLTAIATAVSEIARNIVRFAGSGELVIELLDDPRPGLRMVARDTGPGIPTSSARWPTATAPTRDLGSDFPAPDA